MKADVQEVIKLGYRKLTLYKQQGLFQSYDVCEQHSHIEVCGFIDPHRESLSDLIKRFLPVTA
jgi:hypothetical protein